MPWVFINQLNAPTEDGEPDENRNDNCVATCVSMLLSYFKGRRYSPDAVKDSVYGQGYVGFEAAAAYVKYCSDRGVTLSPFNGDPAALVAEMKRIITSRASAVIFTVPSLWVSNTNNGYTHVMIAYGYANNTFSIADPWGGVDRRWASDYLQARLRMNQVWRGYMAVDTTGLGAGMAAFAQAHNLSPVELGETKGVLSGGRSFAFVGGHVLHYDPATNVTDDAHATEVITELAKLGATARAAQAALAGI